MRQSFVADHANPIASMNTTPLIDVLLVLLIMLIMTIPPQTYVVKLDLPLPRPTLHLPPPNPLKNELVITEGGALLWNGMPISMDGLRQELALTQEMRPIPELHLRPRPNARYGTVDEVLGIVKSEHVQSVGFVGNEAYQNI